MHHITERSFIQINIGTTLSNVELNRSPKPWSTMMSKSRVFCSYLFTSNDIILVLTFPSIFVSVIGIAHFFSLSLSVHFVPFFCFFVSFSSFG